MVMLPARIADAAKKKAEADRATAEAAARFREVDRSIPAPGPFQTAPQPAPPPFTTQRGQGDRRALMRNAAIAARETAPQPSGPFALDVTGPFAGNVVPVNRGGVGPSLGDIGGVIAGGVRTGLRLVGPGGVTTSLGGAQVGEGGSVASVVSQRAAGNLRNVDRVTGAPIRGALLNPSNIPQGVVDAVRNPEQAQLRNMGGIRSLPDNDIIGPLSIRDIAGGVADAVADVGTVATLGTSAGRNLIRRGAQATRGLPVGMSIRQADDVAQEAAGAVSRQVDDIPANVFEAPPTVRRLFGVDPIEEGAQRGRVERFIQSGRIREDNPVATPALLVRSEARNAVRNQATQVAETARARIADSGFEFDEAGRIPRLTGIDETVPGAPTLRDVAARLPRYEPFLSDQQMDALVAIRDSLAPYRQALEEVAEESTRITGKPPSINFGSRTDVMEGGFYIPRGTAETEELADIASRRVGGAGGRAGKGGFEKTATFDSEAAGIEAGYGYTDVADSISGYVRSAGDRTLDQHAANYFLSRTDEAGNRIAETAADRVSPALRSRVETLRSRIASRTQTRRNQAARLPSQSRAAREVGQLEDVDTIIGQAQADLDDLIARSRGRASETAGRLSATQDEIASLRAELASIRSEWERAKAVAASTPRDQGRIPLRGLEAYSFPWEIADEARRILDGETRNPGAALNALNSLLRGVQATGEMSYLGIQGAIGMASGNRAWRRATKAATRAWMNGGENALGRHFIQFDQRAAAAGRPTIEQWAARGLHMAGGNTEFKVTGNIALPDLSGVPGKVQDVAGSVPKRADRGFGTFGDVIRAELADTLAEESLLAGRALDANELDAIVRAANRNSGWSPTRLGGSVGEALNFAPRYLAARIQALGQLGSRNVRDRQLARRLIGRYIGIASLLTVAVNEAMGEETDFRPFSGDKGPTWNPLDAEYKNPNFMRVRALGRDWSFLGPVDATLGVAVGAGSLLSNPTADPKEALDRMRSVFTSPLASMGLDWLVFGENFEGEKLDNAEALGSDLLTRVVPFAAPELADVTLSTVEDARGGNVLGAAQAVVGGVGQAGVGFRGSPLTTSERVQEGGFGDLTGRAQFQGIAAETWRSLADDPEFSATARKYGNVYQYQQAIRDEVIESAMAEGMSRGQAEEAAERAVRANPLYQEYLDRRNGLRTWWVEQNPAEAAKMRDEEAAKPWDERTWTPTVQQREIIDAYLEGQREPQ